MDAEYVVGGCLKADVWSCIRPRRLSPSLDPSQQQMARNTTRRKNNSNQGLVAKRIDVSGLSVSWHLRIWRHVLADHLTSP